MTRMQRTGQARRKKDAAAVPDKMSAGGRKAPAPCSKITAEVRKAMGRSSWIRKLAGRPFAARLLEDTVFCSYVFLCCSLILNSAFGALQLLIGIYAHSMWLGALAVYHSLLAVMQFKLSGCVQQPGGSQNVPAELRLYRFCGMALLCMTPVFSSIFVLIVHKNSRAGYPGFLIYFAAILAFMKIGTAVSNAIKFKTYGSPVLSAAKALSLIAAMISFLTLETAILARYGRTQKPAFYQGMLGTAGGAVCLFTLSKALSMIIQATQRLKAQEGTGSAPACMLSDSKQL